MPRRVKSEITKAKDRKRSDAHKSKYTKQRMCVFNMLTETGRMNWEDFNSLDGGTSEKFAYMFKTMRELKK